MISVPSFKQGRLLKGSRMELTKKDKTLIGIAGVLLVIVVIVYAMYYGGSGGDTTPPKPEDYSNPAPNQGVPNKR